jgi:thioredoxin reductase (NADPH)
LDGADLEPLELKAANWPLSRQPYLFETSVPRIFAIGDVRSGSVKRVASAVGEGSMVVQLLRRVLAE